MASASEQVLEWIEEYIEKNRLGVGDPLPGEHDLVAATGSGRSSVREALTALKVLGIIQSRKKGGITIIRDPVMLGLRHYFANQYEDTALYLEVLEFRAAMEWGLGPLTLSRIKKPTLQALRSLLKSVKPDAADAEGITQAEIEFHRILTSGCGNRLAALFVHLYEPIFRARCPVTAKGFIEKSDFAAEWLEEHTALVDALETGDTARFLKLLRKYTHGYMRGL